MIAALDGVAMNGYFEGVPDWNESVGTFVKAVHITLGTMRVELVDRTWELGNMHLREYEIVADIRTICEKVLP